MLTTYKICRWSIKIRLNLSKEDMDGMLTLGQIEITISNMGEFLEHIFKTGTNLSLRAKESKMKYMKKIKHLGSYSHLNNGLSPSPLVSGKSTAASDWI